MRKQIRQSVFETNSSSTHSVTIGYGNHFVPYYEELDIVTDEFGWGECTYTNLEDKLSYALTFALQSAYDKKNFEMLNDLLVERMPECLITYEGMEYKELLDSDWDDMDLGYIDHQSVEEASKIFNSEEDLEDFIFSTDSYFETDNDNH